MASRFDWYAPAKVARAEAVRLNLDLETRTLRGFRRRVRTDREWSILGAIIGVPVLVFAVMDPVASLANAPLSVIWEWFEASKNIWWAALGVFLIGVTVVASEVRIRREFALFRQGGWIGFSAPTGLVWLSADGAEPIVYDHRLIGGSARYWVRDFSDPLMLVSSAHMPAHEFTMAVVAVRARVTQRVWSEELFKLKHEIGPLRAIPAEGWFPEAGGCLLGRAREAPLAVAIPRRLRDGRWRIRLARVRFTSAEKTDLV